MVQSDLDKLRSRCDLSGSVGRCAYDLDHGCCKLPM